MVEEQLSTGQRSGVQMLIDRAGSSQSKMPMMEIIFDRLISLVSSSYRSFTSFTVDVEIESNQTMRFGEYVEALPNPTLISIVKAVEWNSFIILRVDQPLTYGLIDILFGGRKAEPNLQVEGRLYTSIEQSIVHSIADVFLNELSTAFDPISPITFNLERIESNPRFATIARPEDTAIILRLKMKMESRNGYIDLVIPHSSLDPVKKILQKSFLGDRASKDQSWQSHMHTEIANASVTLSVYLNGITSTIKNIANLKVGDTIILDKEPDEDIFITIDKLKISSGKIGKIGDNVAIKISDEINLNKYKS
jgi:flagellar motor switch protein FliM